MAALTPAVAIAGAVAVGGAHARRPTSTVSPTPASTATPTALRPRSTMSQATRRFPSDSPRATRHALGTAVHAARSTLSPVSRTCRRAAVRPDGASRRSAPPHDDFPQPKGTGVKRPIISAGSTNPEQCRRRIHNGPGLLLPAGGRPKQQQRSCCPIGRYCRSLFGSRATPLGYVGRLGSVWRWWRLVVCWLGVRSQPPGWARFDRRRAGRPSWG